MRNAREETYDRQHRYGSSIHATRENIRRARRWERIAIGLAVAVAGLWAGGLIGCLLWEGLK